MSLLRYTLNVVAWLLLLSFALLLPNMCKSENRHFSTERSPLGTLPNARAYAKNITTATATATTTTTTKKRITTLSITSALLGALSEVTTLVEDLTTKVVSQEPEEENLLVQLTASITETLGLVTKHLTNAGESLADGLVGGTLGQMERVRDELLALAHSLDAQFDMAVQHLNESLINHSESIDMWADGLKLKLRRFNDTNVYRRGCRVVDGFIEEATDELRRCCNITFKPMVSLCRSFRAILAKALRVLADILQRMQNCLEDKQSYAEYMVPCVSLAYDEVSTLLADAVQLRQKINKILPMKILHSKCCISVALVTIEQRQTRLSHELLNNNQPVY